MKWQGGKKGKEKKEAFKLAHQHAGRCKSFLIQEKLDGAAVESL